MRKLYDKVGYNIDPALELQSSYSKLHGSEPVYTNVSVMSEGGMFIECLDYCPVIIDMVNAQDSQHKEPHKHNRPEGFADGGCTKLLKEE